MSLISTCFSSTLKHILRVCSRSVGVFFRSANGDAFGRYRGGCWPDVGRYPCANGNTRSTSSYFSGKPCALLFHVQATCRAAASKGIRRKVPADRCAPSRKWETSAISVPSSSRSPPIHCSNTTLSFIRNHAELYFWHQLLVQLSYARTDMKLLAVLVLTVSTTTSDAWAVNCGPLTMQRLSRASPTASTTMIVLGAALGARKGRMASVDVEAAVQGSEGGHRAGDAHSGIAGWQSCWHTDGDQGSYCIICNMRNCFLTMHILGTNRLIPHAPP